MCFLTTKKTTTVFRPPPAAKNLSSGEPWHLAFVGGIPFVIPPHKRSLPPSVDRNIRSLVMRRSCMPTTDTRQNGIDSEAQLFLPQLEQNDREYSRT